MRYGQESIRRDHVSFKIGDVCVGQNFERATWRNGMECVVISDGFVSPAIEYVTGTQLPEEFGYMIRWSDGSQAHEPPRFLRLKRPPSSFEPCEESFLEDLHTWMKVKV